MKPFLPKPGGRCKSLYLAMYPVLALTWLTVGRGAKISQSESLQRTNQLLDLRVNMYEILCMNMYGIQSTCRQE